MVALEHTHVLSPYWIKVTYDEVGAQGHWYIFDTNDFGLDLKRHDGLIWLAGRARFGPCARLEA